MAISETSTAPADPGKADMPGAHQPIDGFHRGVPMQARLAILATFFALSALASWLLYDRGAHEEDVAPIPADSKPWTKAPIPTASPVELLARADLALREHRFALAQSLYEELRTTSSDHGPIIEYRYALCNESISQLDKAIAGYRTTISEAQSPAVAFVCHLGLARCLFRQGQFAEARRLLYPFLFDESRQRGLPRNFAADARYLLALSLTREALLPQAEKKGGRLVSVSSLGLEIPFYLDECAAVREAGEKGRKEEGEKGRRGDGEKKRVATNDVVVKKGAEARAVFVHKVDVDRPASEVFELLSMESGASIKLSADAAKAIADRPLRLCLQNWQLEDLLDSLADYFGLTCRVEGAVCQISAVAEIEAKQASTLLRERSARALRGVLLAEATHPWTAAACLELGNWQAAQGKLPEAASWFERLVRESPNSTFAPAAYYNLAMVHLEKQDVSSARAAFFRVIDHSPGHDLALKAYVGLGISRMEDDEVKDAIIHLRHALAMAPHSAQHAYVTVTLAAAYVLNKQPDVARATLARERAMLQKSPCKATAAFLDAYAQFLLNKDSSPARREASDLLSTLWRDQDKTVLGPLGDHLIAEAYRDLGFWSHAEQILRQASQQARGSLAKAVDYALADTLMKQHRREEATKLFEKLAATPSSYRARARLQLAQIMQHDKHYKECADICRQLWQDRADADAQAVLQVWGSALDGMGEFAKAAQCYAGKAPE